MKSIYSIAISVIISVVAALFFHGHVEAEPEKSIRDHPVKQKNNYHFKKGSLLINRIRECPEMIVSAWAKWDERNNYRGYLPSEGELRQIHHDLLKLPPMTRKIMKERLLGIYFITNVIGSGLTDWVLDKNGKMFCYMVFNPIVLKKNISELITWKEQTCYRESSENIDISIRINSDLSGFYYILLHESTHVVDYVRQVTPFTEPDVINFYPKKYKTTPFTQGIWCGHKKSCREYPFRKKVRFYGFGGPPLADKKDAVSLYRGLDSSPFFSLYGSLNWAEDLAEFLTFYHLTKKMGLRYHIIVKNNGKEVFRSEPSTNILVRERFHKMNIFY